MSIDTKAVRKAVESGEYGEVRANVTGGDVETFAREFGVEFEKRAREILGDIPDTFTVVGYTDKIGLNVVGLSAIQAVLVTAARRGSFEAFERLFQLGLEVGILYGTVTEREKHGHTSK